MKASLSLRKPEGLALAFIVLYAVALGFQIKEGNQTLFGKLTLTAFFPLLKASEISIKTFKDGFQAYIWQKDNALRSEELLRENLSLKGEINLLEPLQEENNKLKSLLEVPYTQDKKFVVARSLISYGTPFARSVLITFWEKSLVQEKLPVLDQFGVVGRIEEVQGAKARVLLLIDPSSAIGISDQRSGVSGVAIGNGKNLVAKYITNEADVIEGDIFVTSGQDEVFPYGIPVGRAVLVGDGGDYLKKIVIAPFASLDSLSYVLILQKAK